MGVEQTYDWCNQLRQLSQERERLQTSIQACDRWIWDNVVASDVLPTAVPEPLKKSLADLYAAAAAINDVASRLFSELCAEPYGRLLSGLRLTREQYHFVRAMGSDFGSAYSLGVSPLDDSELLDYLWYSDDRWHGYINPAESVRDRSTGMIGMRFGRPPEELSRSKLRPDQISFFQEHLPTVLARFGE